ncbi:MAG: hypothetical protein ACREU2_02660 [Steroidobacteraceae bacterium]
MAGMWFGWPIGVLCAWLALYLVVRIWRMRRRGVTERRRDPA